MHHTTCPPRPDAIGSRCRPSHLHDDPSDSHVPNRGRRRPRYKTALVLFGIVALIFGMFGPNESGGDRQIIIVDQHGVRTAETMNLHKVTCGVDGVDHAWIVVYPGALAMSVSRSLGMRGYSYMKLKDPDYGWESMTCDEHERLSREIVF